MQQYGRSQFADRFAEIAADADYSRFPTLRDVTQYDIRAAAEAMWAEMTKRGWDREEAAQRLTSDKVEQIMRRKVVSYADDDELISVEFEDYWDATDMMDFSAGLLEEMKKELVRKFAAQKRKAGLTVVENKYGIWTFNMTGAL